MSDLWKPKIGIAKPAVTKDDLERREKTRRILENLLPEIPEIMERKPKMWKEMFLFYVDMARRHKNDENPSEMLIDILASGLERSEEYGDCPERRELAKIWYILSQKRKKEKENEN